MLKITFVTLFPSYYEPFVNESIVKRAITNQLVQIDIVNWRDYSPYKHKQVDDVTYGGGDGMLLMVEPLDLALRSISGHKVLLSPQGTQFTQPKALALSKQTELVFIAGRYEGFDERINSLVDDTISIGDYVLTGGELPSLVVADAIIRLVPNVIKASSHLNDSFQNDLLDFPQYTWPREYEGMVVPEVLLNGNHAEIAKWRKAMQIAKTKKIRPDLIRKDKNAK